LGHDERSVSQQQSGTINEINAHTWLRNNRRLGASGSNRPLAKISHCAEYRWSVPVQRR
jgi:hypothetical protein